MTTSRGGPGAWRRVRARPVLAGGVATTLVAGVVFVLVWFQPQTLLYDTVVDEEFPATPRAGDETAAPGDGPADGPDREAQQDAPGGQARRAEPGAEPDTDAEAPVDDTQPVAEQEPAGPVALASGTFTSRNRYTVEGDATVYELDDGSRTLRLGSFSSTNGPDLFVYLTAGDAADSDAELVTDVVDLGTLRGNVGNQNYDIPADVDLDHYDTVVIWCHRFTVGFGAADLTPAA